MDYENKDSIGLFLGGLTPKMAEVIFPSSNIPVYQEDDHNHDLLEYAEPWGGAQNKPFIPKPNALEQFPSMMQQGERPETQINVKFPESFPVDNTTNFGEQIERTRDPGAGGGAQPGSDYVHTKPQGEGAYPFNSEVNPIVTSFPYEALGVGEEQTFTDRAYVYASEGSNGEQTMAQSNDSVKRVVAASMTNGSAWLKDPYTIKIASLEDLYGFERNSSNTLIHLASKELWTISASSDGVFIKKCFNDDGNPVGF